MEFIKRPVLHHGIHWFYIFIAGFLEGSYAKVRTLNSKNLFILYRWYQSKKKIGLWDTLFSLFWVVLTQIPLALASTSRGHLILFFQDFFCDNFHQIVGQLFFSITSKAWLINPIIYSHKGMIPILIFV